MSPGHDWGMAAHRSPRSAFPLRFENERTRELLRVIAERQHLSMNQLAEEMIERELQVMALGLESSLSRTIELLRSYRGTRALSTTRSPSERPVESPQWTFQQPSTRSYGRPRRSCPQGLRIGCFASALGGAGALSDLDRCEVYVRSPDGSLVTMWT